MSRFKMLASVVAVAMAGAACSEAGGPSNSASSMVTGPSAFTATRSSGTEVIVPAAKGGKGKLGIGSGSSSIAVALVTDADADGVISHGDTVRFDVSTTAADPKVSLTCTQNGAVVYGAVTITSASSPMTLLSNAWQGGAASCVAKLYYIDITTVVDLASTSFVVAA